MSAPRSLLLLCRFCCLDTPGWTESFARCCRPSFLLRSQFYTSQQHQHDSLGGADGGATLLCRSPRTLPLSRRSLLNRAALSSLCTCCSCSPCSSELSMKRRVRNFPLSNSIMWMLTPQSTCSKKRERRSSVYESYRSRVVIQVPKTEIIIFLLQTMQYNVLVLFN